MKLALPLQMPAPPRMSMLWLTTPRMRSVIWYFMMADSTGGCSCAFKMPFMSAWHAFMR